MDAGGGRPRTTRGVALCSFSTHAPGRRMGDDVDDLSCVNARAAWKGRHGPSVARPWASLRVTPSVGVLLTPGGPGAWLALWTREVRRSLHSSPLWSGLGDELIELILRLAHGLHAAPRA
tara:strand:+ start:4346 stop:4705 length:360 start_codon:yes stop_codon:yes gene_type:complete